MKEPVLMPFQEFAFNGDKFIEQEFLKLRDRFNITTAVETGTCLGYTTLWLAKNFEKVYTIELNKTYYDLAKAKFLQYPNITSINGDSADVISQLNLAGNIMFFLDAHWGNQCPLLRELKAIPTEPVYVNLSGGEVVMVRDKFKPVIAIHDFQVPGESLGFDSFKGQPFNLEWINPLLELIYSKDGYEYYYNFYERATEIKRGIIYITPKA